MTIYFLQPFPETRPWVTKRLTFSKRKAEGYLSLMEFIKIEKMHFIVLERDSALRFRLKEVQ